MDTFAPTILKRIQNFDSIWKNTLKRGIILRNFLIMIMVVGLSGCGPEIIIAGSAAAAAVGTVVYAKGDLEVILEEDLDVVYAASKKALTELEINIIGTDKDLLSAVVHGRGAEDKKVSIRLERVEKGRLVKLSIRVGTFGDKDFSKIIYDRINKHLIR